jgi:hypothetical protein
MADGRWIAVSEDFPPTLNKEDDPTTLKPNETPDCYGIDMTADGFLASGSIPAGTSRSPKTHTYGGNTWDWYYNRSWRKDGTTLHFNAPFYNDYEIKQGVGKLAANDSIVEFMPALGTDMWICQASGSQLIGRADDQRGFYTMGEHKKELKATAANRCMVIDGQPVVSNTDGVYMFDGRETKELTRSIRDNLGNFSDKPIKADYQNKYVIGDSSFAIDMENGNLYDYGTSGFRFTTRTLAQVDATYGPITVDMVAFTYELKDPSTGGTIVYETKIEDGDWESEPDFEIVAQADGRTRDEKELGRTNRTGRRFSLRITSISSNIKLRRIELKAFDLANNAYTE